MLQVPNVVSLSDSREPPTGAVSQIQDLNLPPLHPLMNLTPHYRPIFLFLWALTPWLASSAVPSVVLESDQGALKTGGSGIANGNTKTLSFTSGTSYLQLTSVDLALVASVAGSFQVDFRLYSTAGSGEPQALLYTTSFTPSLTTNAAWYSLPISYALNPLTSYAFGFASPVSPPSSVSLSDPSAYIKWMNTLVHQPTNGSITGYQGFSNFDTQGYAYSSSTNVWIVTQANNNAFRLYAVPETPAGALSGLGLAGFGVYQLRRRWNRRPEGIPERAEHHDGSQN